MPNDSFPCYCPPLPPLPSSLSLRLTRSSLLMLSGKSFQCSGSGRPEREKDLETAKREEREEKKKKKRHEGEGESAGRVFAEEPSSSGAAARAVPDVCAALHVISRPLRATLWHNHWLHLVLFSPLSSLFSLCPSHSPRSPHM